MSSKNLENEKIYLSSIENENDISKMYYWINNKELVNFNSSFFPVHLKNHIEWFENIRKDKSTVIFGIRKKEDNELIGTCQLHSINPIHKKAELQIRLQLESSSKGYGKEALKILIDYGFNDLNLNKIYLNVFETNSRAISLYEKMGFQKEGILRRDIFLNGKYINVYVMSILTEEWNIR
ncbi:GNAT family N-acetyltransferase [Sulfurospirillum arcachonense]|uniref:GNAT family N-acetyltransferase n=1 Tax=Sulfurospirillum arcachonense TaxID=57666 RepID=UPI00046A7402|nr:GNAT family protein [Sulfurospirillum arcachonense]